MFLWLSLLLLLSQKLKAVKRDSEYLSFRRTDTKIDGPLARADT